MPGTARTTRRQWPFPASAGEAGMIRDHVKGMPEAQDAEIPKITYSAGAAPSTGMRTGDIHLQYVAALVAEDVNVPLPEDLAPPEETV